jgi:hypothetical protein
MDCRSTTGSKPARPLVASVPGRRPRSTSLPRGSDGLFDR